MPQPRHLVLCLSLALSACTSVPNDPREGFGVTQYSARLQQEVTAPVSLHHPARPLASKPAVILMTGCDGSVSDGARAMIGRLNEAGVLVARLRSIEPLARGSACIRSARQMSGIDRAEEAFRTRDELVARGWAAEDNVGLLGFSHGGWAITHAIFKDTNSAYPARDKPAFRAAVAFYPHCSSLNTGHMDLQTPTLMMSGRLDTWTPAADCMQLVDRAERETKAKPMALTFKVFEGATHSWDNQKPGRSAMTDRGESFLAHDAAATAHSLDLAMAFMRQHLALR